MPQGRDIFPQLTVEENLLVALGARKQGRAGAASRVRTVSGARKDAATAWWRPLRRSTATAGDRPRPDAHRKLLILDEPTEGLQPNVVHEIGSVILRLNEETGLTILLVEQKLPFARRVASEFLILEKGRCVAGAPSTACRTTWYASISASEKIERVVQRGISRRRLARARASGMSATAASLSSRFIYAPVTAGSTTRQTIDRFVVGPAGRNRSHAAAGCAVIQGSIGGELQSSAGSSRTSPRSVRRRDVVSCRRCRSSSRAWLVVLAQSAAGAARAVAGISRPGAGRGGGRGGPAIARGRFLEPDPSRHLPVRPRRCHDCDRRRHVNGSRVPDPDAAPLPVAPGAQGGGPGGGHRRSRRRKARTALERHDVAAGWPGAWWYTFTADGVTVVDRERHVTTSQTQVQSLLTVPGDFAESRRCRTAPSDSSATRQKPSTAPSVRLTSIRRRDTRGARRRFPVPT